MVVVLLALALVALNLATSLAVNETSDAILRAHDGTYTMGTHTAIARQVRASIVRNLRLMNQWAPDVRLSAGGYSSRENRLTREREIVMTKFKMLDLAANAGTAVNLLGCRAAAGHDLDFWTLGQIKVAGEKALRIEINGPVPGPAEDNVWLASDHYKIHDVPPHGIHPGVARLGRRANTLMQALDGAHVATYSTQDTEVDIWTDGYKADDTLLKLIRKNFHDNKGMLINLKQRREPRHKYVKLIHFPDLIVQKASLAIDNMRQCKNDAIAWPLTNYQAGRQKLINDLTDLYCLCHHKVYARQYVENHYRTYGHITKICDIDFNAVVVAINLLGLPGYNTLAHAAFTAAGGAVGIHKCTGLGPGGGPCAGGVIAPAAVRALAPIKGFLDEYERR
mmetsp:Transcript_69694/g.130063  ORF Transcript_69694/g.130063 Transcript_69694/m.130063 type:complete len:394 (+) Transcript_69694:83-1264(+)